MCKAGGGRARLPRAARLDKPILYHRVFERPIKSADRYFTVLGRRTRPGPSRLGLAVSRKCARKAVERNRLKRLIRESFRCHRECLDSMDIVVLCRPEARKHANSLLFSSLERHWQRLRAQQVAGERP